MSQTRFEIAVQPSLSALRAFDAAAKRGSFREAAELLSVTPTAVSHHIRGLEAQLGLKLFERTGRSVALTEEGQRLALATEQAFGLLDDTVRTLQRTSRRVVRLAAGPIFTARWLMPRISDLWEKHPTIELEVVPSYRPRMGDHADADIVIRWERMSDMPKTAVKILALHPVAIASRSYIEKYGAISKPAALLRRPILHQRNHWGWLDWFAAMGVQPENTLRGPVFEDANILLRGAAEGQGAIVGWLPLIDTDLAEGRVIRLFDEAITPTHGYYIEARNLGQTCQETKRVLDWLIGFSSEDNG